MKRSLRLAIIFLVFFLHGCDTKPPLYKDKRALMGTFVEVISADKQALKIAFAEIERIEGLLSKYKETSEVSRLNKSGKLQASPDTLYILKKSREFWEITGGAFDITVGPLIELWGFSDKKYRIPEQGSITRTLKLVGMDKILFKDKDNVVEFKFPGMKIDLGAIAKGFAVDCAVKKLKAAGIKSCIVNAGGQIYCLGERFGHPWRIAIKNPRAEGAIEILELKDKAVSTSGDYEQYFTEGTKRYSHILNPETGYPAQSGVIAVTVIAADGLTADALATSIFVLGRARGEELSKKFPGVEIRVSEEKNG